MVIDGRDRTLCIYDHAERMLEIENDLNKLDSFKHEDDIVKELAVLAIFLSELEESNI